MKTKHAHFSELIMISLKITLRLVFCFIGRTRLSLSSTLQFQSLTLQILNQKRAKSTLFVGVTVFQFMPVFLFDINIESIAKIRYKKVFGKSLQTYYLQPQDYRLISEMLFTYSAL